MFLPRLCSPHTIIQERLVDSMIFAHVMAFRKVPQHLYHRHRIVHLAMTHGAYLGR